MDDDPDLTSRLEQSLKLVHERAEAELDSALFDALQWPTTLDDYEKYLEWFLRWIPQQSTDEAWASGPPGERNAQEASDRLALFFWLVDQKLGR
ncbi:MAG: hypothetical protein WBQ44_21525 [Rhodococcus sp. (in: high G+C Gram-positive bacteria)]